MSHFINLTKAVELTTRYRNYQNALLQASYQDKGVLPTCESFDRAAIEALLAQPGCVGLRIYGGLETDMTLHAVVVAYDENNRDILPSADSEADPEEEDVILENSIRCPPVCPEESPLNP